jgi:hypothetical protein
MAWQGIWFESDAGPSGARSPEYLKALLEPIVYPYAHGFVNEESRRLKGSSDPGRIWKDGDAHRVYYSLDHDGSETALDAQGCRILRWLFECFDPDGPSPLAARFSEIPVVVHSPHPARAAAMANALAILRFLTAAEDQAIARIMIHRWDVRSLGPERAAAEYEERVLEFLEGPVFYPEDVSLFDVLDRNDLRGHREQGACCACQIGFVPPLLEWIDECRPESDEERRELFRRLRNSLADEARFLRSPDGG